MLYKTPFHSLKHGWIANELILVGGQHRILSWVGPHPEKLVYGFNRSVYVDCIVYPGELYRQKWITRVSRWSRWHFSWSKSVWFPSVRLEPRSYKSHCGTSSSSTIEATMLEFLFRVKFEFIAHCCQAYTRALYFGGEWDSITLSAVGCYLKEK